MQTNYLFSLNSSYTIPKSRNQTLVQTFYIIYNSLRDLTTVTAQQLDTFQQAAFEEGENLNHWLLISAFVFFCVFVILAGFIIFPIVVGVQKNKVMILSIYFDLPILEIKDVHKRCFEFLCRIDDERRTEAMLMATEEDPKAAEHNTEHEDSADAFVD